MFNLETEFTINGSQVQPSNIVKDIYNKYFEKLQKELDKIGEIVIEGIQENIKSRNYPGGNIDVKRGGTPLYNTGAHIYNTITKQRIDESEVDVFHDSYSEIGLGQYTGTAGHNVPARQYFGIYTSTEQKINDLLKEIISDIK